MNKPTRTDAPLSPQVARPRPPHHPAGLLYTLLRHGKGMTHEEARRKSSESINDPPPQAA